MPQLNAGTCSGVAPEKWQLRDSGDGMIHLASGEGGAHAIYKLVRLDASQQRDPKGYVSGLLHAIFRSPVASTPVGDAAVRRQQLQFRQPEWCGGFRAVAVERRCAVGVDRRRSRRRYRLGDPGDRQRVAVAALRVRSWRRLPRPRDPALAATSLSTRCLAGRCEDSDFAATYLDKFRLGYVHAHDGEVFLVNPRRDFWLNGQEGPGFYRQLGGENEKLEPGGRTELSARYCAFTFTYSPGASPSTFSLPSPGWRAGIFAPDSFAQPLVPIRPPGAGMFGRALRASLDGLGRLRRWSNTDISSPPAD